MSIYNTASIVQLSMPTGGGSDRQLKQDINPLGASLQKVLALKPVTWYWKDDTDKKELHYGFIAQEVEEIFPHLVSEGKWHDGTDRKFLSVGEITPHMVEAIKEQNVTIVQTTKQLSELVSKIHKQQEEIDRLQNLVNNK